MNRVADCLFCRIVSGEIGGDVVDESESSLAFRDVNPQAPTHVLIVPKAHTADAAEHAAADSTGPADLLVLAARVAAAEGLAGYRLVFNTGADAGQTVFHTHLHLLGGRSLNWPPG
ncbi:MAG: HIT domain-containing protein [Nocardioides sp.]